MPGVGAGGQGVSVWDRVSVQEGENSGDGQWWELHNNVNELNTTELYSQMYLK